MLDKLPSRLRNRIRRRPWIGMLSFGLGWIPRWSLCWIWTGKWDSGNGYGKVMNGGRTWMAHRLVYTTLKGGIPDGLVLDHLCRRRRCCNPAHLRPTTVKDNTHVGEAVLFEPLGEE